MVKPSEGDNAIGKGMRSHVAKITEWEYPDQANPGGPHLLMTYANKMLCRKRSAQSALVTRLCTPPAKRYEYQTSPEIDLDWKLYSIVVQSPLLRRVLESVFTYYSGDIPSYNSISTSSEHVELIAPFKPCLKERLEYALRKEQDPETKQHISLLCNVLGGNFLNTEKIKENAANGIVYFEDLPLIFKPGAILFTVIEGQIQLVSLRKWYHGINAEDQKFMRLECTYVDWRGTSFGNDDVPTDLFLHEFEGPVTIEDLPVFPLIFQGCRFHMEDSLVRRGKRFEAQKGYHYCAYDGFGIDAIKTIGPGPNADDMTFFEGRVIIDTAAFYKLHPDHMQRLKRFDETRCDEMQLRLEQDHGAAKNLSREQLRLCPGTLRAYSVDEKKWLHIMLEDVKDIKWDNYIFGDLAQPEGRKEMILAFADSQMIKEQDTGNSVQGKNSGVIVICGPPGAGRKLTATAIAEELHLPLYTLSAGDLGKSPEEIELFLITTLEFVAKWKAVLVLDDATAFVKTRSTHRGQRNRLVPIYQRILEYYDSILFLNTNLHGDIDNAFESRPPFSSRYHRPVADTTQPERRTEGDVEKPAQTPKPYGQVGDVFSKAKLLAMELKAPLSSKHVRIVTRLREADAGED